MKINHIITEFVTPQATAQDPGLEREKDVDVIFFGLMPQDFTARTAWKALEDVLPREYPAGSERAQNKIAEVSKNNGAVVTTKPLSIAQKVVKEFQARGIKCRIDASGLEEDITRRGFLKGAGAAAVAGAAGGAKAHTKEIYQKVASICYLYLACKGPYQRALNQGHNVVVPPEVCQKTNQLIQKFIKVFPGGKDLINSTYANVYTLVQEDESREPFKGSVLNRIYFDKAFQQRLLNDFESLIEFNESVNQGLSEATRPPVAPDPQNYDSDVDYYNDRDADPIPPDTDADYENMDETKEKIGNMDADAFDDAINRLKKLAGQGPLRTVYDPARRVYKNVPHAVQPAQQPKKAR